MVNWELIVVLVQNSFCKKSANTTIASAADLLCLEDIVSLEPNYTFFTETKNIFFFTF